MICRRNNKLMNGLVQDSHAERKSNLRGVTLKSKLCWLYFSMYLISFTRNSFHRIKLSVQNPMKHVLTCLLARIQQYCLEIYEKGNWFFLRNKAPAHSTIRVLQVLVERRYLLGSRTLITRTAPTWLFIRFYFIHFSRLNSISIILFWENTGSTSENYEVFEISNHSSYSST